MATTERESTSMLNQNVYRLPSMMKVAALGAVIATCAFASAQNNPSNQVPTATTNAPRVQNNPTAQSPLMTVPEDFAGLKLAPGFLLNIQVYDEPDLSAHVRVDNDGNIGLPFIKTLHVGGETVPAAKKMIEDKFRADGILKNPQITIDVEQF